MTRHDSQPMADETKPEEIDVVIVGGGIAGLAAVFPLLEAGRRVIVLEKSRGLGGRMATRRLGGAVCDHGAQFFTVRGRAFGAMVAEAHQAEAATIWCDGFARGSWADGDGEGMVAEPAPDGHPRWRGVRGMTDLPKRLAALAVGRDHAGHCDIRTGARVVGVAADRGRVRLTLEQPEGEGPSTLAAAAAILTTPVPQALELLTDTGIDPIARQDLQRVDYDPCFALLLVLDRPSCVPPPGAIQFADDTSGPIAWLADNQQKGISPLPALTVHASGRFSRAHLNQPADTVAGLLCEAVRPWIGAAEIVEQSLHRWKYARPTTVLDRPLVAARHDPPIVCCGDAFAGPKVEGAASSGLAAGRWVARVLGQQAGAS
jgi:renalase